MNAAEYIKQHVTLRQVAEAYVSNIVGGSSKGIASCPLHKDKTPSMSLHWEHGVWHCFSCGKGGDLISLVREMESTDFVGACRKLVEMFGIPAPVKVHNRAIRQQIADLEQAGRRPEAIALIDQLRRA